MCCMQTTAPANTVAGPEWFTLVVKSSMACHEGMCRQQRNRASSIHAYGLSLYAFPYSFPDDGLILRKTLEDTEEWAKPNAGGRGDAPASRRDDAPAARACAAAAVSDERTSVARQQGAQ